MRLGFYFGHKNKKKRRYASKRTAAHRTVKTNRRTFWHDPLQYRPPRTKARAGNAHGNTQKWTNYSIANQNPTMRNFLYRRQHGVCLVCGQSLDAHYMQIHHTTYDYECRTGKITAVAFRDSSGRLRQITCPPCGACKILHPMRFCQCSAHLIAVHARCHMQIHGIQRK